MFPPKDLSSSSDTRVFGHKTNFCQNYVFCRKNLIGWNWNGFETNAMEHSNRRSWHEIGRLPFPESNSIKLPNVELNVHKCSFKNHRFGPSPVQGNTFFGKANQLFTNDVNKCTFEVTMIILCFKNPAVNNPSCIMK